jgi:phosphoglycerate dehydrogenase-like enzyme
MRTFQIKYSGDFLNEQGQPADGTIAAELYEPFPFIRHDWLRDQAPQPGDKTYSDRLYSMQLEPHHIADADGVVNIRPYVRASAFAKGADRLVAIGRCGVGVDKIDLPACTANDVVVFNAPHSLTHSTATATVLLLLAAARNLLPQERMARSGYWGGQSRLTGEDLPGKTLGIVGLGRIAQEVIRLLAPFGMRVLVYSRHATAAEAQTLGVTLAPDLGTLLRESDYVCLLCQLDDRTRGMFGEAELRMMKKTAVLVNTGRGELIRQGALVRALQEGWIAKAALDVFEHEPLPADDPLIAMDNVVLTPHWLPVTRQSVWFAVSAMAEGMIRVAQGRVPDHVVNRDVLDRPGFQAKLARFAANRARG